jgi:hypothetical protein
VTENKSIEEVMTILRQSGIPIETLNECAKLVYEWEESDEPDARLLIVKIARLLSNASST